MTFLDWFGGVLLALFLAVVLGAAGRRRTRGQGRVDVLLLLAAAVLIALVIILWLLVVRR